MKNRKILALLLFVVLVLTACGGETTTEETDSETEEVVEVEAGELTFKEGTYTGTAEGYNGPVELDVTFSENAVTDIEIKSHEETEHVGDVAFPIVIEDILAANGTGVDVVAGATFSSFAIKTAVNDAAEQAEASDLSTFKKNTVVHEPGDPIEETYDVVVVGGGGAGMMAAAQATQNGDSVLVMEKAAEIGGNTLVSGGQFQSVMPYLVWDAEDPDATTGEYNGEVYEKVKSDAGRIHTLEIIANWNEEEFDGEISEDKPFTIGDTEGLSHRGVHAEYLPTLQALKSEINDYLAWAKPQLEAHASEQDLTLFSTPNLHIFQTYYGGLRPNREHTDWIYGNYELVSQVIEGGQELKPWLEEMGAQFVNDAQITLVGGLWQRQNQWIGSEIDGEFEEGRWAAYFKTSQHVVESSEENEIMRRTEATDLILEDGKVIGVKAVRFDGTEVTAYANKGVILATGGYAANIPLVQETNDYWEEGAITDRTGTTNRNAMQGDGMTIAENAGANLEGLDFTQLMPLGWIQDGNLAFGGGEDSIYLNPNTGDRFVDESSERDVLSAAFFENGMEVNNVQGVIVDIANVDSPITGPYPYGNEDVEWRQYVRDLDGMAELFEELGINISKEKLEKEIIAYDLYVMSDGVTKIDIEKQGYRNLIGNAERDANGIWDPDSYEIGDLRVRFLAPSTHHTMGGISIDTGRRALDPSGQPIPGLYAAGEVSGGIHGGNRLGGNAIVEIFVSGRTAANTIHEDFAE